MGRDFSTRIRQWDAEKRWNDRKEKKWNSGRLEGWDKRDGILGRLIFTQYSSTPTFQLCLGVCIIPVFHNSNIPACQGRNS